MTRHDIMFVKTAQCSQGHIWHVKPGFVLTRIPCSTHIYSTDEPDLLFYAEGRTYKHIVRSLADKLCHFWQIYGDLPPDILRDNKEAERRRDLFMDRVQLHTEEGGTQ